MTKRTFFGKLLTTLSLGVVIAVCLVLQFSFIKAERAADVFGVERVVSTKGVYKAPPNGKSSRGLEHSSRETTVESHTRAARNKLRTYTPGVTHLLGPSWSGTHHFTHAEPVSPFKAQVYGGSYIILISTLRI